MSRWGELLERGLQEDGSIDRDEPAAIELEDLTLDELRALVYEATQDEHYHGLAVLLFRVIRELRDIREQLESHRRAAELRRTR
ncbi:MAG: hypothetical protein AB7T31_15040 [Gemmatimonadales bacterium]